MFQDVSALNSMPAQMISNHIGNQLKSYEVARVCQVIFARTVAEAAGTSPGVDVCADG